MGEACMRHVVLVILALGYFMWSAGAVRGSISVENGENIETIRKTLCDGAWTRETRIGRVAVESVTLFFCEDGTVVERIFDDTGRHEGTGTWTLDETENGSVLDVRGGNVRHRGRFDVAYAAKDRSLTLRIGEPKQAYRFEHRGSAGPSPCKE